MDHYFEYCPSRFGYWKICASDIGITEIKFLGEEEPTEETSPSELTKKAVKQLAQYFKGSLRIFNLPIDLQAGTDFQKKIWKELRFIEYGKTTSYQHLANEIGSPEAVRAVGAANGANPIAILLPCHRVIGSDGSLTGYAYGLDLKRELLKREGAVAKSLFDQQ